MRVPVLGRILPVLGTIVLGGAVCASAWDTTTLTYGITKVRINKSKGGSIDSILYGTKEMIEASGYGRGVQVAWQIGDRGECANPTQAGNILDDFYSRPSGHSRIMKFKSRYNSASFEVRPAWWVPPGEDNGSHFCDWQFGAWGVNPPYPPDAGVVGPRSASRIQIMVTMLSAKRIDIDMGITVSSTEAALIPSNYLLVNVPYLGMSSRFTSIYRLRPSGELVGPAEQGFSQSAPILCDADMGLPGSCMGWYSPAAAVPIPANHPHLGYLGHEASDNRSLYGLWITSARVSVPVLPGKVQRFKAKLFIGNSPESVAAAMLYNGWPAN